MSFGFAARTHLPGRKLASGAVVVAALFLVGCSTGPGTREEFIDILGQDEAFSETEATCIADAVFDRYGQDEDALGKISAADSYEFFDTESGVPGFTEFFDGAVRGCTAAGPTSG